MCEDYIDRTNVKPPIRTPMRKKTLRIQTNAPTPCRLGERIPGTIVGGICIPNVDPP
jgi:hypothetical protein